MPSDGTTHFPDTAASSSSFVRRIVGGVALINLFIFGVVAFSLYNSYGELEERTDIAVQNLSQLLAEGIAGDIDKIDMVLLTAADEIERQTASGGIDRQALNAFLFRQQGRLPEAFSVRVLDAKGIVSYGQGVNPSARQDNSDREYFIRQRDNPKAGLVIAKPLLTRIDKKWAIVLSRPIHLPDGSFGGVAYTNVGLDYLTKAFPDIDVGRNGSISLRDTELNIFAIYPVLANIDKIIGEKFVVPELKKLIQAGQKVGTYITGHTLDGVERKYAIRRIQNYPLYVVVGRSTGEYMVRWKNQAVKLVVLALLFCLASLISSWLVYRNRKNQLSATLELARKEEKIRISEARLQATIDNSPYMIWQKNQDGRYIAFNQPFIRALGEKQPQDVLDKTDFDLWPKELAEKYSADDIEVMHTRKQMVTEERAVNNGQIYWVETCKTPIVGEHGIVIGTTGFAQDITERKQVETAVRQLNAELEQRVAQRTAQLETANKELEEFSYSMSHDMRTPLRALDGFSKILLEEHGAGLDDEGKRLLTILRNNARHMGRLVDDILHFLSMGRRKIEHSSVDIAKLAAEIFAELQAAVPARHLRLVTGTLPPAWGDCDMIREALHNLLSNAIKFSPADDEALIEIGGETGKEENIYSVTDHGIGFDMRYAGKLFRVFERVHPTGQYEGSGIGLAIVKRIITRHGGRVWAEGKPNEGATFYFALPV